MGSITSGGAQITTPVTCSHDPRAASRYRQHLIDPDQVPGELYGSALGLLFGESG